MPATNYVSAARFEILATRPLIRMGRGDKLIVQSEPHPESGMVCQVELKYNGDAYVLDKQDMYLPFRYAMQSLHRSSVSAGPLTWQQVAKCAIALLAQKEANSAQEYCALQDEAFLRAIGQIQ